MNLHCVSKNNMVSNFAIIITLSTVSPRCHPAGSGDQSSMALSTQLCHIMPTEVRVATNKHQNTQRLLLKPFFADTLNKLEVPWILGFSPNHRH